MKIKIFYAITIILCLVTKANAADITFILTCQPDCNQTVLDKKEKPATNNNNNNEDNQRNSQLGENRQRSIDNKKSDNLNSLKSSKNDKQEKEDKYRYMTDEEIQAEKDKENGVIKGTDNTDVNGGWSDNGEKVIQKK